MVVFAAPMTESGTRQRVHAFAGIVPPVQYCASATPAPSLPPLATFALMTEPALVPPFTLRSR